MIETEPGTWLVELDADGAPWFKLVKPALDAHVRIKDTYADEGSTIPVTGVIGQDGSFKGIVRRLQASPAG
jgi:hypothetical protein